MKSSDAPSDHNKSTPYLFSIEKNFRLECRPEDRENASAYWFLFHDDRLLLADIGKIPEVPLSKTPPIPLEHMAYQRCVGIYDGSPCMAVALKPKTAIANGLRAVALRGAYGYLSPDLWTIAGRAVQILTWDQESRFCGRCGAAMEEQHSEAVKKCPKCHFIAYPRLSPAVIVSVIKDDAILLGRAPRFPPGMYSVLAGFVEPGETLEEAVIREVKEEVNIQVADVRYVASQPWPFPHSLMVGFTARYEKGVIRVNKRELEDAGWFTLNNMPPVPPAMSIARRLIDRYLTTVQKN